MGSALPFRSFALFRPVRSAKRGDIVLVDHPHLGRIVRKVSAISMTGRVCLLGMSRSGSDGPSHGRVDPERVLGKLALRLTWGRFLPGFTSPRSFAEPQAAEPQESPDEPPDETPLPQ